MSDFIADETGASPIGERLRIAREAKGLTLDEVANQTRIPIRHLEHIETGQWEALPAVTYSVGFARSYANAVDLDGSAIGAEVRALLGTGRSPAAAADYYQPADPARVPPRSLTLIAGLIAVLLVVGYLIWRNSAVEDPSASVNMPLPEAQPAGPVQPAVPQSTAGGPVALTAVEEVWLRIDDANGGPALFQGQLAAGQRFEVPATAQRPIVRTGRPQVLRVSIGGTDAGLLGPAERIVSNVSLLAPDVRARSQGQQPSAGAPPAQ